MKSDDTLVSSCIDLIADASSRLTPKTSMRPLSTSGIVVSEAGIVSVTINFFK